MQQTIWGSQVNFLKMLLLSSVLVLLGVQLAATGPKRPTTPSRGCVSCSGKPSLNQTSGELNATTLAHGEPCGVYTPSCATGLRCAPPRDEPRPLRTLLEGRGVCINTSNTGRTERIQAVDSTPTEDPEQAPCRKLLTSLVRGLNAHLFQSHHDIYVPNCDRRGFFTRRQCWSSRGKTRGRCWCVDENGVPVTSLPKPTGRSC